ncbi:hypothetical protein C8P64_2002 [Christiangramia gaetbulicola]|uniref:Uncharacterized protein n=1 Tax=Christiangramia gaetbulicola TaxID=703340 RepID=A0A2T6AI32_9FLAO|nr:hypothetical protein [Christiangramia gaetbulicola]PTX43474.1 hypothetical protein C8P64_2002 [Christiangramia gaetbulicola]
MNKQFLYLIVFLLISCSGKEECSYVDDYYQLVYEAEKAYYQEDYQMVFDKMSKATSNCELINQPMIYEMVKYAESAAIIGKEDKALELLRDLILNGYTIEQLEENQAFSTIVRTENWGRIENEYSELRENYLNSINLELRDQISEMQNADQYHRQMLNHKGINRDSIWMIINKTDSINDIKFKQIIEVYGYPDQKLIGGYNIDQRQIDPGILLFHFDDYDYYTKTLKKLIIKGEAPPESLGNFVDSYQRRVQDQKKYIYGIYDNVGPDQIINFDNLDKRRKSIGLAPMELKKSIDSLKRIYYNL